MLVSVILPAHNEAQAVGVVVRQIYAQASALEELGCALEVIVVDNASEDATAEVASSAGARVVREPRKGYGWAYKRGLSEARGDVIVCMDADATYPAEAIPILVEQVLDGSKFVSTRRHPQNGYAMSVSHGIANRVISWLYRIRHRVPLTDTQSGMWAMPREALMHLFSLGNGMELSQQIKGRLCKRLPFVEVPIVYRERLGASKLRPVRDGLRVLADLIRG